MTQAVQQQQDRVIGAFTLAVAEELRAQMARKRVSGRELARRLHVSSQWMSQRTRGIVAINTDEMEMLAAALGITIPELLADAAQRVATGVPTGRYGAASGGGAEDIAQVIDLHPTYRQTTDGYGSSACGRGQTDASDVLRSAESVNYADAA